MQQIAAKCDKWTRSDEREPPESGWYPTLWVMPDNEGVMPRSTRWNGMRWETSGESVDYFINEPYASAEAALAVAYENDVEAS